jgi:steroid delta-isomerase-like uncharacterized protein
MQVVNLLDHYTMISRRLEQAELFPREVTMSINTNEVIASINTNKDVVRRFFKEFWNGNNPAVLDEILDPAYYDYSSEPRNREGLERLLTITNTAFPGHETIIEEIVGESDTVAVCETFRGTHAGPFRDFPASGKQFEVGRYHFFKFKDGKITSQRGLVDLPALLQQIGINR